ncbi:MAG: hypothetical protein AABZ47_13300 [Planctomycetota bacterium]
MYIRDGQEIDPRPFYILSPSDVTTLQSVLPGWQPGQPWIPQLEGVLLTEYSLPPNHVENLSMPQVLSILKQKPIKSDKNPARDTVDEASADEPPIDDTELVLLVYLNECGSLLKPITQCALEVKKSEKVVGKKIADLVELGLVTRPKGPRKGATLTPKGKSIVDRQFPKTSPKFGQTTP